MRWLAMALLLISSIAYAESPKEEARARMEEAKAGMIDMSKDDLVNLLGIGKDLIKVKSAEAVIWNDGALGYHEKGFVYTQALVDGFRIILTFDRADYEYHTNLNTYVKLDPDERKRLQILRK